MSPSGVVSSRLLNPLPAPLVLVWTRLAPKSRSVALVVVTAALLLLALVPEFAAVTSTGLLGSAPAYSTMRMSADVAPLAKVTATLFVPAAADTMFFA
jgi:hypothetical protein